VAKSHRMGRRVLFTAPAGLGHIHPMVPLARAMVARGHDVLWAVPGLWHCGAFFGHPPRSGSGELPHES
jgi:hypothetical protein